MRSAAHVLDAYGEWLDRQALAARTRSAYRRWVAELLEHPVAGGELDAFLAPAGDDDRRATTTAALCSPTGVAGSWTAGLRRRR